MFACLIFAAWPSGEKFYWRKILMVKIAQSTVINTALYVPNSKVSVCSLVWLHLPNEHIEIYHMPAQRERERERERERGLLPDI